MKDIIDLLTDNNALIVAGDIVTALEQEGNTSNVDFDFKMSEGKMVRAVIENEEIREVINKLHGIEVPAPNTWFSFDTKIDSMLGFLKDSICKAIDAGLITDQEFDAVQNFIPKVLDILNTNPVLVGRLRKALRKIVLNNAEEEMFPVSDIRVVLFEFGAKEDYGDIIKVFKYARASAATGRFIGEKSAVAKDLLKRRKLVGYARGQDTKEVYSAIILEQRDLKNPLYDEVLPEDVEILSEAKECHIDLFADYSPLSKDEIVAKVKAENAKHENTSSSPA